MTHSQNQKIQTKSIFKWAALIAVLYWACGTDTNASPPSDVVQIHLDIDPGEAQAMSIDSLHPDPALMYRGKDGIHVMYNYSK